MNSTEREEVEHQLSALWNRRYDLNQELHRVQNEIRAAWEKLAELSEEPKS